MLSATDSAPGEPSSRMTAVSAAPTLRMRVQVTASGGDGSRRMATSSCTFCTCDCMRCSALFFSARCSSASRSADADTLAFASSACISSFFSRSFALSSASNTPCMLFRRAWCSSISISCFLRLDVAACASSARAAASRRTASSSASLAASASRCHSSCATVLSCAVRSTASRLHSSRRCRSSVSAARSARSSSSFLDSWAVKCSTSASARSRARSSDW
mmetsp:Transcript_15881/g.55299  ORF Transcript_15881/g.55299 Transcript_15881/m.55299 type:complete len:219 (+) Transcript_15881:674-1330(+)